ncbi:winged helix-turn-helix transcriptional regulator [Candidatus Woesearchaeota archaeon]|nr:winged helix-turn-helix transcriptional regulator [Candidatus Woesearchaeota archaeon]
MYWKEISFVLGSKQRTRIILALETPMTPTHLAKRTGISLSNMGTKLSDLQRHGIVECLTPRARKGRVYSLTPKGVRILKAVKSMETAAHQR